MTGKFRDCIRAVAKLTSDDELLRIAELPEVPVSLEKCRQLDPQTRVVMACRQSRGDPAVAADPAHWPPSLAAGRT